MQDACLDCLSLALDSTNDYTLNQGVKGPSFLPCGPLFGIIYVWDHRTLV